MADFSTNTEEEAFNRFAESPAATPGQSIYDRMQAAWFASRDYYTADRPVSEEGGEASVDSSYFDMQRAENRLRILSVIQPFNTGSTLKARLEEVDAWVHGEK